MIEKNQRWAYHDQSIAQNGGEGVTRRILAYTDGLMCVENTFQEGAVGKPHSHPHLPAMYYSPNHMFSPKNLLNCQYFCKKDRSLRRFTHA